MIINRLAKGIYLLIAAIIGLLIIVKSTDYITPDFNSGFLVDKQSQFFIYKYFLYAHIIGAPIALFAGAFQILRPYSIYHGKGGKLYFYTVVFLAAPGGFYMAFYAIGGMWSIISFLLLSTLWFVFTIQGLLKVRNGQIQLHKSFMTRSFILANSAILIRLLIFFNHKLDIMPPVEAYVWISWLSWLPALIIYEVSLLRQN